MGISATDLISMFLLGLLGTGHCVGMCGPMVFAFPASTGRFTSHLWYHAGRIQTYTFVGAVLGGLGAGFMDLSGKLTPQPMAVVMWIQFALSLCAALFMLLFGLVRFGLVPEPEIMRLASPESVPAVGWLLRSTLVSPKGSALLMLGLVMGLIPCGLSYAAFARALPCGSALGGAALLIAFGVGTLPGLLLLGTGFFKLFQRNRQKVEVLAGLAMIAISVRLLLSALNALG